MRGKDNFPSFIYIMVLEHSNNHVTFPGISLYGHYYGTTITINYCITMLLHFRHYNIACKTYLSQINKAKVMRSTLSENSLALLMSFSYFLPSQLLILLYPNLHTSILPFPLISTLFAHHTTLFYLFLYFDFPALWRIWLCPKMHFNLLLQRLKL
jgi:hypothetical protein